ncbi:DegT/DnrJ/EryC1/StrS family aminotransferase, partial [Proteus mirabilis]
NILSRRYFYPLITDFDFYKNHDYKKYDLSISKSISDNVICLPMHHNLSDYDINTIINFIKG